MSEEHLRPNDKGHVLAEKSKPVEYLRTDSFRTRGGLTMNDKLIGISAPVEPEIRLAKPHGDFRIAKIGEDAPHDIGCNCLSCVQRRRKQAQQPEFRAIIEEKAARLPAHLAAALRTAFCVAE